MIFINHEPLLMPLMSKYAALLSIVPMIKNFISVRNNLFTNALILIVACLLIPVVSLPAKDVRVRDVPPEGNLLTEADDDLIYALDSVCYPPEFPGGKEAMYQWIATNFQYPPSAADEYFRTRIVLKFVVTRTGDLNNITVHHPDPALRKEAIRVVNAMPKWIPGRNCDGKPVNVAFILPMQFLTHPFASES